MSTTVHETGEDGSSEDLTAWWLKPHLLILFFILPVFLVITAINVDVGRVRDYREPYFVMLGALYIATICSFAFIGGRKIDSAPASRTFKVREPFLDLLALLTFFAYGIWFYRIFLDPSLILNYMFGTGGSTAAMRNELTRVSGITTLAQLGIVYTVIYFNSVFVWRIALKRRFFFFQVAVFLLAVLRALAWSERLAVLELIIPAVIVFTFSRKNLIGISRYVVATAPFLAIVGLVFLFSIFEYFRSWSAHYKNVYSSYGEFILERVYLYYFTALNNGMGLLAEFQWPTYKLQYVMSWVYKIPVVGAFFSDTVSVEGDLSDFLQYFANPEFNNPSGIYVVYYDLGIPAALVLAGILGFLYGRLYRGFSQGAIVGCLLYPVVYISILEMPRVFYLGESRFFPVALFIAMAIVFAFPERGDDQTAVQTDRLPNDGGHSSG